MTKLSVNTMRRRVLIGTVATLATAPFVRGMLISRAQAGELKQLSEDDPTAKALKYHHDATKAPRADKPGHPAKDQFCHNCQLIKSDSGTWRPCQIFPGKAVNKDGWCASWTPKV